MGDVGQETTPVRGPPPDSACWVAPAGPAEECREKGDHGPLSSCILLNVGALGLLRPWTIWCVAFAQAVADAAPADADKDGAKPSDSKGVAANKAAAAKAVAKAADNAPEGEVSSSHTMPLFVRHETSTPPILDGWSGKERMAATPQIGQGVLQRT